MCSKTHIAAIENMKRIKEQKRNVFRAIKKVLRKDKALVFLLIYRWIIKEQRKHFKLFTEGKRL